MYQYQKDNDGDEKLLFIHKFKQGVWLLGIAAWVFAIVDRTIAICVTPNLSTSEIIQLLTTSFLFLNWLYLKPDINTHPEKLYSQQLSVYSNQAVTNLRKQHIISQEYILPFPYLCQIYHLLNLKHLETIHRFSLNNLKIVSITELQATDQGGKIKFQTALDTPVNALRIWRQEQVEVDLTLHNPHTVELSIPLYNHKRIIVLFNALPLTSNEHYFFIDIYSDIQWFKPLMQILLHFASCLTLFEDLPYLRALAERNIEKLFDTSKQSNHETMYLYNRFVELYGTQAKVPFLATETGHHTR